MDDVVETNRIVYAALVANVVIALAKFVAYLFTGNVSMLSETYHSASDTGNQVLLLIGLRVGAGDPDRTHPFGHGKIQYFFGFVVSILLFGVAGVASLSEGWHHLGSAYEGGDVLINYAVLGVSFVFEGWALSRGYDRFRGEMDRRGLSSYLRAYHDSKDAALLASVTEDTVAVTGVLVAALGVFLTSVTHDAVYDAGASIVIGLLLMGFAILLGWENRGLIMGESVTSDRREELLALLAADEAVAGVHNLRTSYFGPDTLLVAAELEFDPDRDLADVEDAITRIEGRIESTFPSAKYIYIEPYRD